jgi:hypothetical protein
MPQVCIFCRQCLGAVAARHEHVDKLRLEQDTLTISFFVRTKPCIRAISEHGQSRTLTMLIVER